MAKRAPRSSQDIPSAQNFSPAEIELPTLLDLVKSHAGDVKALRGAVRVTFYGSRPLPKHGQGTVWGNVISGMVAYGIITPDGKFHRPRGFPLCDAWQ